MAEPGPPSGVGPGRAGSALFGPARDAPRTARRVRPWRPDLPGERETAFAAAPPAATRAIVAPRVAIRQHLTTMWRLLLARGGRRRSDWPPDGPAASARRLPERAAPAESREGPGGARSGRGCACVRACKVCSIARYLSSIFFFSFNPVEIVIASLTTWVSYIFSECHLS